MSTAMCSSLHVFTYTILCIIMLVFWIWMFEDSCGTRSNGTLIGSIISSTTPLCSSISYADVNQNNQLKRLRPSNMCCQVCKHPKVISPNGCFTYFSTDPIKWHNMYHLSSRIWPLNVDNCKLSSQANAHKS
uniref:Uncharacterized protein n=1 Tax=Glossina pallidipes TaxID=7398 RepID=A0A1A9ZI92_GLOPL